MVLGFFMILVDSTIVSIAVPTMMTAFDADVTQIVWVTSAYLLAYAVPLLITGRLGDRLGPRRLYLVGLAVFTLASLWCGLVDDLGWLIAARAVQGLGAAMMSPQTMAVITRTFPASSRGQAMALWGATAGVAMLVGPVAGGLLVDGPGWEWIFFINIPVGVIGFVAAWILVPRLPTTARRIDGLGVVLAAVGVGCLVFGIQEGETYDWGTIRGILSVPLLIGVGVAVLALFVLWQARTRGEALVPLRLFHDRNFTLSNIAVATVGFAVTAMAYPLTLWAQQVRELSPTQTGLLLIPMAVLSGAIAPIAGRLIDTRQPRGLVIFGVGTSAIALGWLALVMTPTAPYWQQLLPIGLLGVGSAFMWGPLATTATRNLDPALAGAGAGVYNTTRQIGAVLGSAAIAAVLEARMTAAPVPPTAVDVAGAMAQSMVLPAAVLLLGAVVAAFLLPGLPARLPRE